MLTSAAITELMRVAATHHGLFSTAEAGHTGIDGRGLEHLLRRGWVRRVRRGVYAVGGGAGTGWDALVAAALAGGDQAVLSHWSAAAILGFDGTALGTPELTIPSASRQKLDGVKLHQMGPVPAEQRFRRREVWVTTPVRTIVDLAAVTEPERLGAIIDDGLVRRLWSPHALRTAIDHGEARRPGLPLLRSLVEQRTDTIDSQLEGRVFGYLEGFRPFETHYQIVLDGHIYIVDAAWPWYRLAAEIDGRTYRTNSRTAFERETRKLNALTCADWLVVHLSAGMSRQACCDAIAEGLRLRGAMPMGPARRPPALNPQQW